MNRYTNRERAAVKSVVVDLNAQYIKFIKALFPNARIIIDRFHFEKTQEKPTGKKLHSISEVKFLRSSTPFDKDPFFDYFHYISRLTCIQKNG